MRTFADYATSFSALVVAMILLSASTVAAKNANSLPGLKGPPMTVVLVKGPTGCTDTCHEWISAEGPIFPDTDSVFRKVLKSIGKRSVPIMINSPGGSVDASLAIGRMLRSRHLDVSVTRTMFDGCSPADSACSHAAGFKGYTGTVSSFGAFCASACAYVIAGGEHRYVSSGSFVGVHSIITFERHISRKYEVETRTENGKKVEVSRRLVSETASDPYKVDPDKTRALFFKKLANYYKEMGIGDQLIDLTFATPATSIHVMTRLELVQTHLMTVPLGGEAIVGFNPPPAAPQAARVGQVLQRPPTVAPPAPPLAPPTPSSSLEFVDIPAVALPEGYDVALNFAHSFAAPTVAWTATVHKDGLTQPKSNFALRLDLGDGRGLTASPSISDPVTSDELRGEMSLADYCSLATNGRVRVRLSAKQNGNYAMRELLGTPQELLAGHKVWPACATFAAAKAPDPAPPAAPDPVPPIEKVLQNQAVSPDVDVAEAYRMDMTFERSQGSGNVAWFAIVRKGDQVLPKQQVAVRLEFPDGHIASANASLADAARPASVEGEMSLQDYCALANGAMVRLHVSATSSALRGPRDVTGDMKALPVPQPVWSDCAPVKSATLHVGAPTPSASSEPKPPPAP